MNRNKIFYIVSISLIILLIFSIMPLAGCFMGKPSEVNYNNGFRDLSDLFPTSGSDFGSGEMATFMFAVFIYNLGKEINLGTDSAKDNAINMLVTDNNNQQDNQADQQESSQNSEEFADQGYQQQGTQTSQQQGTQGSQQGQDTGQTTSTTSEQNNTRTDTITLKGKVSGLLQYPLTITIYFKTGDVQGSFYGSGDGNCNIWDYDKNGNVIPGSKKMVYAHYEIGGKITGKINLKSYAISGSMTCTGNILYKGKSYPVNEPGKVSASLDTNDNLTGSADNGYNITASP